MPNVTQIYISCKENQSYSQPRQQCGRKGGGMLLFWAPFQRNVMYVYSHENGMCLAAWQGCPSAFNICHVKKVLHSKSIIRKQKEWY